MQVVGTNYTNPIHVYSKQGLVCSKLDSFYRRRDLV